MAGATSMLRYRWLGCEQCRHPVSLLMLQQNRFKEKHTEAWSYG
jgi:hypothetical protein